MCKKYYFLLTRMQLLRKLHLKLSLAADSHTFEVFVKIHRVKIQTIATCDINKKKNPNITCT